MSNRPDPDPLQAVGETLRRHRIRAGLSLGQLGLRTGLSDSTLCRIEQGKRPMLAVTTVMRLAEELDIDIDDLTAPFRLRPLKPRLVEKVAS